MSIKQSISSTLLIIHVTLAVLWIYQGLVPKIIYKVTEEQQFWAFLGFDEIVSLVLIEISGYIEILFGLLFLIFRQSKLLHFLNISSMLIFFGVVTLLYPFYFHHAFNPFVMNIGMASLSIVALQLLRLNTMFKEQLTHL